MTTRDGDRQPDGPRPPRAVSWVSLIWVVVLALVVVQMLGSLAKRADSERISYTEFKRAVDRGRVAEVLIKGAEVHGAFVPPEEGAEPRPFSTTLPSVDDPELLPLLQANDVTIRAETTEDPWWQPLLVMLLPWLLLLGLFLYAAWSLQRRMGQTGQGPGGLFGFGRSRAKRFRKEHVRVTFDDVAGLENAKRDLREIIDYLRDPAWYTALGAKIPKGVLLVGPPGTGKTLLAKAVARQAEVPFFSVSGSEFIEMFVGVGAARVRDMFESAKKEAPAVIFIDELDSVGRARGAGLGGGHDEREQTLNQILSEMDGFSPQELVVVLAATNRPDVLDPAMLRPGRFDRKIVLELPGKEARRKILEVHLRRVPLAPDVDLDVLAARTTGFSGADLENLVNEGALLAARDRKPAVDMATLARARDKILLGAEREAISSEDEKRVIAYHEAGHALVARLLPEADPLDRVTIVPRGRALGATEQTPEEERHKLKRSYLVGRLAVVLAGRVAERLVFGEVTSGAEEDLRQATQLARRMVCQWGMSETLGPVVFRRGEEHVFLGREMAQARDFSEHTARIIDEEIRALVEGAERRDEEVLGDHHKALDVLAEALLEHETLGADDVGRVLESVADAPPGVSRK